MHLGYKLAICWIMTALSFNNNKVLPFTIKKKAQILKRGLHFFWDVAFTCECNITTHRPAASWYWRTTIKLPTYLYVQKSKFTRTPSWDSNTTLVRKKTAVWVSKALDNLSLFYKEVSRLPKHTDAAFGHSVIDNKIFIYLIRPSPVNMAGTRDAALPEAEASRSKLL